MPVLYRSKSVRRYEENNCRLTSFIEKDNIKVLAAAAIQLLISTPELEKWFKSSTGTLCFLKDFTQKNFYYFRLYSLMQGQLWEQEIKSPFNYQKLSCVFHYLTLDRFNYGFKFICEDEAERFFSLITKFSTENNNNLVVRAIYETNKQKMHSNDRNDSPSSTISLNQANGTKNFSQSRQSRRTSSVTPYMSIANAAAAVASIAVVKKNSNQAFNAQDAKAPTEINSSTETTSTIRATSKYLNYKESSTVGMQSPNSVTNYENATSGSYSIKKVRKTAYSSDGRRKIDKNDISCPFRCSCDDLHINFEKKQLDATLTPNCSSTRKLSPNFENNRMNPLKTTPSPINLDSLNKKKYSSIVQQVSANNYVPVESRSKLKRMAPLAVSVSSSSNNSNSSNVSPAGKIQSQNDSSNSKTIKQKAVLKLETDSVTESNLSKQTDPDSIIIKDLLKELNLPINSKLVKFVKDYLARNGDIKTLKTTLEYDQNEKSKLVNYLIKSNSAALRKSSLTSSPNLLNANNLNGLVDSSSPITKQTRFQTVYPLSSNSPSNNNTKIQQINFQTNSILMNTPTTPNVTNLNLNSSRNRINTGFNNNSYQMTTPMSLASRSNQPMYSQPLSMQSASERTPIKSVNNLGSINCNRTQTPSPSTLVQQFKQNLESLSSITPNDANAPPKPPRRTSLKTSAH